MEFSFCPRCATPLARRDISGDGGPLERLAVETNLVGNYIFERKNEVMLCYHVVARGTVKLGAELAEYRRYKPAERPALRVEPGRT